MDFTNINDPAGVSALLEHLRASQAWSDVKEASPATKPTSPPNEPTIPASTASPNSSVADLLFRLRESASSSTSEQPTAQEHAHKAAPSLRKYTFQQSLPVLSQLAEDPTFAAKVEKLRRDQDDLEQRLWKERQALVIKQEEKVKIMVTKNNMTGTTMTQNEAKNMRQAFEKELGNFDRDRVMPAWDALISRQQAALEEYGVPTMFDTTDTNVKDKQQRVINVLENILGSGDGKES